MISIEEHPTILEASKIVIARGSRPIRIVLRNADGHDPFVTHLQILDLDTRNGEPRFVNLGFESGHYFQTREEAEKDFLERISSL